MLIFLSDGTGYFVGANFGPYWETPITWYVQNNVLTILEPNESRCQLKPPTRVLSKALIEIKEDVIVPCMSGNELHFTGLYNAAFGLDFFPLHS